MGLSSHFSIFFILLCSKDVWSRTLIRDIPNANNTDDRIVGGVNADIQNYPYQAFLLLNDGRDNYGCGGSIVNEFYIVTAAHCLARIRSILVRIGSSDKFSGGSTYNSTTFYSHPRYDDTTSDYDVGIVVVNEGMNLDGFYARAISLVRLGNDPQEGRNLIISGWGDTSEGGTSPTTLMAATVPVVSRTDCDEQLPYTVTTRMICAGYEQGGIDTCQGDSGGPAVLSTNGRLAGITSFGNGCARPNSPGVYTRVGQSEIRAYILAITGV